jgi:F0F1-type ATP synthase delta subunit
MFIRDESKQLKFFCSTVLLAENGRLKSLDGIINAFQTIMAAYRGEVPCEVTIAKVCKTYFFICS